MRLIAILLSFVLLATSAPAAASNQDLTDISPRNLTDLPKLGANLTVISYWQTQLPFADAMKLGKKWQNKQNGGTSGIEVDDKGYPTAWDDPKGVYSYVFTHNNSHYPTGDYILSWEGEGSVYLGGQASLVNQSSNQKTYRVTTPSIQGLAVTVTSAPVTNIHLWMPDPYTGQSLQGQEFNPAFLDNLEPFEVLRFLDWNAANHSNQVEWSSRKPKDYVFQDVFRHWDETLQRRVVDAPYFQAGSASYEYMIDLCNQLGEDMWITVPHAATNDYVQQLATLIRDRLDPNLRVWVEYSNEVWNWQFDQAHYVSENQNTIFPAAENRHQAYGYRSGEIFSEFETVFGGTSRLVRAISGQSSNPWVLEQALTGLAASPGVADVAAATSYFNNGVVDFIYREGLHTSPTAADYDRAFDYVDKNIDKMKEHPNASVAQEHNLPLVAYEGGSHIVGHGYTQIKDADLTAFLTQMHRHPRMATTYAKGMDWWQRSGGKTHVAFTDVSKWDRHGSWGHKEFYDQQSSPQYDYIVEWKDSPFAQFEMTPLLGKAPLTVDFDASSSLDADSYSWEFGDGSSASGVAPTHTYSEGGNYTVKLTATTAGYTDTKTKSVEAFGVANPGEILAEDSFDLGGAIAPQPLHGFDGGTGWETPWRVQGGSIAIPGFNLEAGEMERAGEESGAEGAGEAISPPASLSSPASPASSPGHATGGYQYLTAARSLDKDAISRYQKDGTTLWMSAVLENHSGSKYELCLSNTYHAWGCRGEQVGVVDDNGYWALRSKQGTKPTTVPSDQPTSVVVKLEFKESGDRASVFLNPDWNSEPTTPDAEIVESDLSFSTVGFSPGVDINQGGLDEIRFGETFEALN